MIPQRRPVSRSGCYRLTGVPLNSHVEVLIPSTSKCNQKRGFADDRVTMRSLGRALIQCGWRPQKKKEISIKTYTE